ncbi:MAG TPA: MBL fold metallo-hydrolase [Gemmatimonadaceae bacterium]|nr:MBL fold metallo-hydrolase [Gemmatimonadaceae bacterium]
MRLTSLGTALLVALPNVADAQAAGGTALTAATRGLALIDSAIAANGGLARLRAVEDFGLTYRGRRWMIWQSEKAGPPWNVQPTLVDMVVDLKNNRLMRHNVTRYPVDFAFVGTQMVTGPNALFFDPTRAGYNDVVSRATGSPNAVAAPRRELPALELLGVLDRAESVRWVGERSDGGRRLQGVSYSQPNGAIYTLWIDAATKRLARLEWLGDDAVDGDQLRSYDYSGYRTVKDVPVPTRLVERRNGEVVRDDSLTFTINERPADAVFTPPASGYLEPQPLPAPEREPVRKLAENVWLLQQLPGGNRVMFVAFRDYVMVLEAPTPQSAADSVLEIVRRTVPGKPVRYVAFSHHHDDHGGGLRPYIAQGATIVTTPATRAFVERVASAKHVMRPDALSASPRAPVIETFTKKRVFTDGDMTVELHDIGPTSHVNEITLAYLPKERLVFQGDLIILPARGDVGPANMLTAEFAQAVDRLDLDVQTIVGVHGRVGTTADLREAVAKRRP